jgi:hypothetical protein
VLEDAGAFAHLAEVPFVVKELEQGTTALGLCVAGSAKGNEEQKEKPHGVSGVQKLCHEDGMAGWQVA